MNNIELADSNTQLNIICNDLKAIRTVIATVNGEEDVSCEREILMVVLRALEPIINDVEDVIQSIDKELEKESGDR